MYSHVPLHGPFWKCDVRRFGCCGMMVLPKTLRSRHDLKNYRTVSMLIIISLQLPTAKFSRLFTGTVSVLRNFQ